MKKIILKKLNFIFFGLLFGYLIIVFRNAFSIYFFDDDFIFLKLSHANNIFDFINFFSPFKDYFYRPIPTELFYFLINTFNQNLLLGHTIVFITYFVGLIFLFKISLLLSKSKLFSYIFILIYAISLTHVFQLYQLDTFQEICLFTFLSISFFLYLKKYFIFSIVFFVFALMSKETAILFPILIFAFEIFNNKKIDKKIILRSAAYFILSFIFLLIYKQATTEVMQIETYKIILSPVLIINNSIWYLLWSFGLPNFIPNYIQSILFKPTPGFWNLFNDSQIRYYFYLLIIYFSIFTPLLIVNLLDSRNKTKKLILLIFTMLFFFFLFISLTLPIIHRWQVRLTVPFIFIACIQAIIIYLSYKKGGFIKITAIVALVLYIVLNVIGVRIHESSGLFLMDSMATKKIRNFIEINSNEIKKHKTIYFTDDTQNGLGGSIDIKNKLGGDAFLYTFFPNEEIKVLYGHENKNIPKDAFIIQSKDFTGW